MGIFSHLLTFGAGFYLGTYLSKQNSDNSSLIRINNKGLTVGTTDVIKISPDRIDFCDETFKIIIGGGGNNKKND